MPIEIKFLSIVIPVYNEAENLPELLERLIRVLDAINVKFEIIFVEDGSTDGGLDILKRFASQDERIVVIEFTRNYGQHAAVLAGMKYAKGDVVITIDADLQNPPEEIPKLVKEIREGYEIVGTFREHRKDSIFRKVASKIINLIISKSLSSPVKDWGSMLRAYIRPVVNAICQCSETSTFIPALACQFAKNLKEIPVQHFERRKGKSKYKLSKLVKLQFDLMLGFSILPIKVINLIGFLLAIGGIGFSALLLILRFLLGAEWAQQGVFTLFGVLFFFVGLQFMAMGILGEYISRIYTDVRKRPQYVVHQIYQKDRK